MSSNIVRQTAIAAFNDKLRTLNTKLSNSQIAIGLDISGNYIPDISANYISSATSVQSALQTIDTTLFSVATTYAPTAYVNSSIAALVNSAPDILDTLGEIASAIGSDPSISLTLTNQISIESARARAAEAQLTSDLTAEITRATAAEGQLTSNLSAEITRATAAEAQLTSDLTAEITRATASENTLSTMIVTETTSRQEAISTLTSTTTALISDLSGSLHIAITDEETRATTVETLLTQTLLNEITRSTDTDTSLRQDLTSENSRATAAESQLRTDLSGEIVRAIDAEAALDGRISTIEQTYIKKDGSVAFTATLDLGNNKIVNVADPLNSTDACNKQFVDTQIAALGSVFEYVGTIDPSETPSLDSLTKKETGDYYRVVSKGSLSYTDSNSSTQTLSVNPGDGVIKNSTGGWDVIDNSDPTLSGTSDRITITGNANDGYQADIAESYVGQDTITTLGTVTTGIWSATTVATAYGGTGKTTYAKGDILVGTSGQSLNTLSLGTSGSVLRSDNGDVAWIDANTSNIAIANTTNFTGLSNVQEALDTLFNYTQIRKIAQHAITTSTDYSDPDTPNTNLLAGKVNFINYDSSNLSIHLPPASTGLVNGTVFRIVHNGAFGNNNYTIKYKDISGTIQNILELAPSDSIALVWNSETSSYLYAVGI